MFGNKKLLKALSSFSIMTFISRILGFVRDVVIAQYFGASSAYDAFIIAFKIPNFLRRLFAEGAFSQAFVPIISEYKAQHNHNEIKLFLDRVTGCLLLILLLVTTLGFLSAPYLVKIFAPGFVNNTAQLQLASNLLQITFPYVLFISMVALSGGILNSYSNFALPAFTPVLLNISFIIATIFIAHKFAMPIYALAWAVFFAGLLQLLLQLPALYKLKLLPSPKIFWQDHGVQKILKLMSPALLGVAVTQINLIIDSIFASFLREGSISWLYFSVRLMELPLGMFGVALATVVLPKLSKNYTKNNKVKFQSTSDWALQWVLIISLPAAIGLYILAEPLIELLFMRGAFKVTDVLMTAMSLKAYAGGVVAFMLIKVLASIFYSQQDVKTPVYIAIIAVIVNIALNAILVDFMQHAGLALATTLSAIINAGILLIILIQKKIYIIKQKFIMNLLMVLIACFIMTIILLHITLPVIWLVILGAVSYSIIMLLARKILDTS